MTDIKYTGGGRYKVHFDSVSGIEPKEIDESAVIKRREEEKQRKEEFLKKTQVVEGIPGRCKIIERDDKQGRFMLSPSLLKEWENDKESILYYYYDIEILSGTNGYILKKSNGKMLQQVTIMS